MCLLYFGPVILFCLIRFFIVRSCCFRKIVFDAITKSEQSDTEPLIAEKNGKRGGKTNIDKRMLDNNDSGNKQNIVEEEKNESETKDKTNDSNRIENNNVGDTITEEETKTQNNEDRKDSKDTTVVTGDGDGDGNKLSVMKMTH